MPPNDGDRSTDRSFGLRYWMERVLEEIDRASRDFAPDPVHDLRVALRRCRSMARGFMAIDSHKAWNALQKEARQLFRSLGKLRDVQVMKEWVLRIGTAEDPVALAILGHLDRSEHELKLEAVRTLRAFDRERWRVWLGRLHDRTRPLTSAGGVFQLITLQAWTEAYWLHKQALRNRSAVAYHRLRIGVKKFRYSVENFLPALHEEWGGDLKEIQDGLGEAQDLRVLWGTLLQLRPFPDPESRERWRDLIAGERAKRIGQYREKMVGRSSLWRVWRQALPPQDRLQPLSLQTLEKWASFHGIDLVRARHVRRLALQLYDGLSRGRSATGGDVRDRRALLHVAAILHELGRAGRKKNDDGSPAGLLRQLPSMPGLPPESLHRAVLVIRCQRGRSRDLEKDDVTALPEDQRQLVMELAGILRLARALARGGDVAVRSVTFEPAGGLVVIRVAGYDEFGPLAEKVARARCLLERVYQQPIMVRSLPGN